MTETKQIIAINAFAKLALKILKDKDYDALSDEDKILAKDAVIDVLREIRCEYGEITASLICDKFLKMHHSGNEETKEYTICDNVALAMNIVLKLEFLEDILIDTQNTIEYHKEQLVFHQKTLKDEEQALRDIKNKIEALKSKEQ